MGRTRRIKAKLKKQFNDQLKYNQELRDKVRNMKLSKGGCTSEGLHESKVLNKDTYYRY